MTEAQRATEGQGRLIPPYLEVLQIDVYLFNSKISKHCQVPKSVPIWGGFKFSKLKTKAQSSALTMLTLEKNKIQADITIQCTDVNHKHMQKL